MATDRKQDCIVCRKHRGQSELWGGVIYEDDLIFVSHAQLWGEETDKYLGHLFIEPKRHIPGLPGLSEEEAKAIGLYSSRLAEALVSTQSVDHVYMFIFGHDVDHLHIHIIGRYPNAPRKYWGTMVDEWPEAPRGRETEIIGVADRLREYLHDN
jgi:diadenosine tetraphosphate (Ap4A) HIT family hydrolase